MTSRNGGRRSSSLKRRLYGLAGSRGRRETLMFLMAAAVVAIILGALTIQSADDPGETVTIDRRSAPEEPSADRTSSFVPAPVQSRPTGRPTRTLFVGTSITGGMAASTVDYAWANLVLRALEQQGPMERVTMPILPEPPNTARNTMSFRASDIPVGIDLGFIELVTNDISRTEIAAYRAKYGEFVSTFREKNPGATLICLGAWSTKETPTEEHEAAARELCVNAGGYFVPINDLFMDPRNRGPASNASTFGADEFHPNNLGEMRIAEAVLMPLTEFYPGDPVTQPGS